MTFLLTDNVLHVYVSFACFTCLHDWFITGSRPYIFLSGRVHPGESNSSWVMKGQLYITVLMFLCVETVHMTNYREIKNKEIKKINSLFRV